MAKRKASRIIFFFMFLFVLGVAAMNAWEVIKAREYTQTELSAQLKQNSWPLTYRDLTMEQLQAILAIEDPLFFQHSGVDLATPGAGLTTITQAVAKWIYFERFEPGIQKITQTLYAYFALDPFVSKMDQITLFINLVGLGKGVKGFHQAAIHYYKKTFDKLSSDEFLSLLAMVIAPKNFNLRDFPQRNRERVKRMKKVISGEYKPKSLMDIYYGKLDEETQKGLAPFSYFESIYEN